MKGTIRLEKEGREINHPNLRIGTCSWKYPSWAGLLYSREKGINYLYEYSRQLKTVEIDQWFWSLFGEDKISLPQPGVVEEYQLSVPADFEFTIKMPNSLTLTHFYRQSPGEPLKTNPYFLSPSLYREFLKRVAPLGRQIGALMLQFEYLNKQKMPSQTAFLERLKGFLEEVERPFPLALEIRNPNYLNRTFFEFLQGERLGMVFLQGYYMPPIADLYRKFHSLIPDLVIIRLHGPGRQEIEKKSRGKWNRILEPRDEELSRIVHLVADLLERGKKVYLNVNNHYEGSAPLTIRKIQLQLKEILLQNDSQ